MKIKYIILFALVLFFILADLIVSKKKKRTPLKTILLNLSNTKIFNLNKKSDYYKKLKKDLIGIGLDISPELFNVITIFITIIAVGIVVILNYLNKLNLLINFDDLKMAADILDMPELTQINFSININLINYTILLMLTLPRIAIKLAFRFKLLLEEKEILMLQTYTLMMIKANKPVKSILISLTDRSKMFKNILRKTVNSFSSDPNLALQEARNSTANQGFEKIIRSLEQTLNNDREISIVFLKNHRKLTKELKAFDKTKKNTKKSIASTMLLIIPLIVLLFIAGYPFFKYTLKMLNYISI